MLVTAGGPLGEVATAAAAEAGVEDALVLGEAPGLTPFAELMGGDGEPPAERPAPGDAAVMLPSSGTTGLPKLVELSHHALVANELQTAIAYPIAEGDRVLGLAPFFHSMGLSCVLHHALASGATVVSIARFDLEVMLSAMAEHRVANALVAPTLLGALARHPLVASFDLPALRMLGFGGAPVTAGQECAASSASAASSRRATGSPRPVRWSRSAPSPSPTVSCATGPPACSSQAPRPRWSTPPPASCGSAARELFSGYRDNPRGHRRRPSTLTAGCTRAISGRSTRTATSRSPVGRRS